MSSKNAAFNRTWWYGFFIPIVRLIILCKNALPGGITRHAKFKEPISDWSSFSVPFLRFDHLASSSWSRMTLSCGNEACICSESNIIPKNSSLVAGPTVFAGARGTFSSLKVSCMLVRLALQSRKGSGPKLGGSIIRKSSKKWQTKDIPHLLRRIHSMPSDNWLKRNGALLKPKGRNFS